MAEMSRKKAIEKIEAELNNCLEREKIGLAKMGNKEGVPALQTLLSHAKECPSCKLVEEVVGWLKDSIGNTAGTPGQVSFIDARIDAWEEVLKMLTKGE